MSSWNYLGISIAVSAAIWACSSGGTSGGGVGGTGGGGTGGAAVGWKHGDCDALGATTTPSGACYFPCQSSSDCPGGASCVNQQFQPYCRVESCDVASDCGPTGWDCQGNDLCMITCTTVTSGPSTECPGGLSCHQSLSTDIPTCNKILGSSCGEPCPTGCCSLSGNTCCKPPFCAGDCASSPCCH